MEIMCNDYFQTYTSCMMQSYHILFGKPFPLRKLYIFQRKMQSVFVHFIAIGNVAQFLFVYFMQKLQFLSFISFHPDTFLPSTDFRHCKTYLPHGPDYGKAEMRPYPLQWFLTSFDTNPWTDTMEL